VTGTWKVGDVTVSQILEMPVAVGELDGLIEEATPDVVRDIGWLHPDYATEGGQTLWSLHSYVVDTGSTVILVDTCCGNGKSVPLLPAWGNLDNPYLERLAAAGYRPEQVDIVLGTHLHLDHVGWNTVRRDGRWVPTFPHARYTYVRDEFDYHSGLAAGSQANDEVSHAVVYAGADPDINQQTRLVFEESIQPCVDAGLVDLVDRGAAITDEVTYISTPGHTKWHHSVGITSRGERAFITGDFIHHPVQLARPDWSSRGDFDRRESAVRRAAFLEEVADTDTLVLGTHFAGTSAGHVVRRGDGYELVAVAAG
jgi:glyoxylase-like metal-dependent hydrolase (beta-lactamase superfamily II)